MCPIQFFIFSNKTCLIYDLLWDVLISGDVIFYSMFCIAVLSMECTNHSRYAILKYLTVLNKIAVILKTSLKLTSSKFQNAPVFFIDNILVMFDGCIFQQAVPPPPPRPPFSPPCSY